MHPPSIIKNRLPKILVHLEKLRCYREYLAALISLLCVFNFGTTLGWEIGAKDVFMKQNEYGFVATVNEWKLVSLCLPIAATIFSLPMGFLVKNHGCKVLIYLQTIPYVISWMMLIFTRTIFLIYISRLLQGMCGATVCVVVPLYNMDISRVRHRGRVGTMFFGVLMYGVYLSYFLEQNVGMHVTNVVNLALVILIVFMKLVPESPTYYVYHNKREEAKKALEWLHGSKYVERELNTLQILMEDTVDSIFGVYSLLKGFKNAARGIIKAWVIMALYNLCGGMMILSDRSVLLYENDKEKFFFYNKCLIIGMIIAHFACFMLIDRIGRRLLLLISALVMTGCAILIFCWYEWESHRSDWTWQPIIYCYIYTVGFSFGLGPVAWILGTELMSMKVYCYGNAIMACSNWLFFTLTVVWLNFTTSFYSIFGLMFVAGTMTISYSILCVPDTKGVSLSRIQLRMVPSTDVISSTTSANSTESIVFEIRSTDVVSVVDRSTMNMLSVGTYRHQLL